MKLSKISIPYRAGQKLLGILAFAFFAGTGAGAASPIILLAYLALFAALFFTVAGYEYLYWRNFEYRVEQDGLKIVSGVISKNDRDIPLKRIQNVDVNRNIAQRLLGIAKADIETAGGGSTEASLRYVTHEDAKQLQKQVRELKNRRKSDTEKDEPGRKRDDFILSDRNLAILSLASVDMRLIGAVGVLISLFGGFIGSQLDGAVPQAAGAAAIFSLMFLAGGFIWISSAVSKFIRFYDFRLAFHDNALEYERGLLNRASGTIPEEKIQDIIIEENFIQRYFGYASLEVETAGYTGSQQGEIDTGAETIIPLAKRVEVEKFAEEIGGYTRPEMKKVAEKARSRYFRRYMVAGVLFGLFTASAYIVLDLSPIVLLPSFILILAAKKAAQLKWENIGYCLDEKRMFTRKGFWNRQTYVVPYFRVQNLMQTQTIFQRRWGQSNLLLDTAGSVLSYPEIVDMDSSEAEKVRAQVFDSFKESLKR